MSQTHFPASLGQQALNHHMDGNILSISHSPPSTVDAPGPTDFGSPRKYTLLSRPQQLASSSSIPSFLPSAEQLNSSGGLNQQSMIPPSGPVSGRAARGQPPYEKNYNQFRKTDDYYDTEDPSVNLHDFIVNSMQAQKNRVVLMKLEEEFVNYVSNPARNEPLKLPPWDSYHRMLAHRVAAYFGLEHNVDPMDKTRVIVGKGPNTRMPKIRFGDYLSLSEDSESIEPKLILKRDTSSLDKFEAAFASVEPSSSDVSVKVLKSYEEREEEYEKARARIFNQQSPLQNTLPFDLATKTNQRMSSSIFPSVMHHRRAASDTSMFKRMGAADIKKDSSSNQSSRSATPLVTSSLLRLGGSCELLSSSVNSRVQPPIQVQTSPKPAQQQSSVLDNQGQAAQYHPQPPSSSNSNSPSKYDGSVSQAQHSNTPASITACTGATATSVHYHPVQTNSGFPVVYPQPPAAALLTDPNWYPYQQMMLYQVSPQGYVPTPAHYLSGGSHVIPGAVYHPYPVAPGVAGQPLVNPPVTSPPQQLSLPGSSGAIGRLPIGDQLSSPSHPNSGIALIRPVPQQASPIRLAKVDAAWNFSPTHHFSVQQSMLAQQLAVNPNSGQPAFAAHPGSQVKPSYLAERLDSSLHISNPTSVGETANSAVLESDTESVSQREISSKPNMNSKMKMAEGAASGDGSEGDSRFMNQVVPRLHGNGAFPVGSLPLSAIGEPGLFGGHMISPTHPPEHVQYMQHQMQPPGPVYGAGSQEATGFVNSQAMVPNNPIHFPPGTHSQPSTPTIGPLNLAPPGILQAQQQGIFSPPSTGITRSPVQILGHTLGTSLFSPPPSSGNQHGLFVNSPTSSGKVGFSPGTPSHPPVGSGTRFRHFDSLKQGNAAHMNEVATSLSSQPGFQSLPPRLAQQHGQKGGNRYQNQRHPSNRASTLKGNNHGGSAGPVTLGDHMPSQFVSIGGNSTSTKREPLLPTPPSTQMVKLDTNLTCGVPVHVMEVVDYPSETTPERAQAFKAVSKLNGLVDLKTGKMTKTGEEVVVAIFSDEETAIQALQMKHSFFSLSIPRNNHAKFILSLL